MGISAGGLVAVVDVGGRSAQCSIIDAGAEVRNTVRIDSKGGICIVIIV